MENSRLPAESRRKRRRTAAKIVTLVFATVLALAVGELVLRIFPTPAYYMNTRDVVQQWCTRPDPEVQYVNRENCTGPFNNREFRTTVRINSHGLRDREFPYDKPAGVTRYLVLGDSFAFGWGVEAEETAAKVIERGLPGSEVLNGGCSGWGSLQELAFLKKEGVRYQPDVVLLFYVENDLAENQTRYEFQHGKLMYAGVPTTLRSKVGRFLIRHSAIWNLVAPLMHPETPATSADASPLWAKLSASIVEMQHVCKENGARLVVVYTPTKDRQRMPMERETFADMQRLCAEHKIDFVDPIPALREAAAVKPVFFNLDDHWTAAGHEAAGKAVAEYLRQHDLAPDQAAP